MKKIIFLGSGGGGNLKFIHNYSLDVNLFEIIGVFTDRKCGAFEYGEKIGVHSEILSFVRSNYEDEIFINKIKKLKPDIIITNVHKILSNKIVKAFSGRLINLHYSYLPAFGGVIGMKPVDQAIEKNNKFIGCTVHFVNNKVDDGKTIAQGIFPVDMMSSPYQSTFECGALTLLAGIYKLCYENDVMNDIHIKNYWINPFSTRIEQKIIYSIIEKLKK
jgi:phosphoribosylglycinamide formyltransferase 1